MPEMRLGALAVLRFSELWLKGWEMASTPP